MKKIVKNNISFKRAIVILAIVIVLVVLFIWSTGIFSKNRDATKFYNEYKSNTTIKEDNLYTYANKEKVLNILDHETGVLYFGYSGSSWCKNMIEPLNSAAKDSKIKDIYYYDIKNDRDELSINENGEIITEKQGTAFYRELLKILDNYLTPYVLTDEEGKEVNTEEKRIYVPLVVFVKEGKVVFAHQNTVKTQEEAKDKLSEKEKEDLINIYKKGFNLIK